MQSPPLELVLDVLHIGSRNLIRNVGDADRDTISEITRAGVEWADERLGRGRGQLLFAVCLYLGVEGFRRHIVNPLNRNAHILN